ncbi:MAG: type II toxin-antitoxin system HicB family antitoxin [Hyphomicrobiales bacterium]|nr:type II toxin-antitoxin system HicB family antitoxin [Hyphomicrobiales bacterium]
MNTLSYNGYKARIEFDETDSILIGHIVGINDVIGFHADSVAELKRAFQESVDDYIETCAKIGKDPDKAYSGKLMLRISPQVHANSALAAKLSGKSLTRWVEDTLIEASELR